MTPTSRITCYFSPRKFRSSNIGKDRRFHHNVLWVEVGVPLEQLHQGRAYGIVKLRGKAPNRATRDVVGHSKVGIVGRVISQCIWGNGAYGATVWYGGGWHRDHPKRVS